MRAKTLPLVLCVAALACTDGDEPSANVHSAALDERYVDGEPSCGAAELGMAAPVITSDGLTLWPPNHKLHELGVADCATAVDACGEELNGEFLWGSSDEPINDIGDGNHEPDILFSPDCESVALRSERQGPRDGRVYKLGVRFIDAAGNQTDGECTVVVDHDQRGVVASDSGEAYRITLDGTNGLPLCDGIDVPEEPGEEDAGEEPPPPEPDAGEPPPPEPDAGEPPPPEPDAGLPPPI
jgi:hypothetical protein